MKLKITAIAHHRNGICGAPFYAVLFDHPDNGAMAATLFEGRGRCAVYSIAELAAGNIAFGEGNSWRGDEFEDEIRPAVTAWEDAQHADI